MRYISVLEAALKWNVSVRQVQRLLQSGRIPDAKKYGAAWLIPADASKPIHLRREKAAGASPQRRYHYLSLTALPKGKPECAFEAAAPSYRTLLQADLAYRRGDPEPAKQCWRELEPDDDRMLTTAILATVAAICSGDYPLYREILCAIDKCKAQVTDAQTLALLSLPSALASVSMALPNMTPEWLKIADFSLFSQDLVPFLLYLHSLHLRNIGDCNGALCTAKSSLLLCAQEETFTWIDIDNLVLCATASFTLGEAAQARRYLQDAITLGFPYGFTASFANSFSLMGGLLEECLGELDGSYRNQIHDNWSVYFKNWMLFRNRYTQENITTVLTLREYQIAHLIVKGASCAETARCMNLSVGRIKNILNVIYGKLYINKREQLKAYVL